MSVPDIESFKAILLSEPLEAVVKKFIFEGEPYVFRRQPSALDLLHRHLCGTLKLSKENVLVVGSGKIGFSLNPDTFPRLFSEKSDIDVVVIDKRLFDTVWMTILRWHYPRKGYNLGGLEGVWARERRYDVYWGWFKPDRIRYEGLSFPGILKPLRDISTSWFNAFRSLSQHDEFSTRNINGRLYRSWDHALRYHVEGLRRIRQIIQSSQAGA